MATRAPLYCIRILIQQECILVFLSHWCPHYPCFRYGPIYANTSKQNTGADVYNPCFPISSSLLLSKLRSLNIPTDVLSKLNLLLATSGGHFRCRMGTTHPEFWSIHLETEIRERWEESETYLENALLSSSVCSGFSSNAPKCSTHYICRGNRKSRRADLHSHLAMH